MEFKGKHIVVTGAASGIGAASARAFSDRGAHVSLIDLNAAGARAVADQIGAHSYGCDVSDESAVNATVKAIEAESGSIDVLFNNAGIATGGDLLETDPEVWQTQWNVNVMSHVYTTRAVLPRMLERGDGYLIQTASMAGYLSTHGNLTYAATKHAVVGFAEWMSITYHHLGVRTSLLAPLGVDTPMLASTGSAFADNVAGPIKTPEAVAEMVCDAVEAERFLILTDEIAQTWMNNKNDDLERWLAGMRRMQRKIEAAR